MISELRASVIVMIARAVWQVLASSPMSYAVNLQVDRLVITEVVYTVVGTVVGIVVLRTSVVVVGCILVVSSVVV